MKTDMKKILIPVLSLLMAAFAVSCTPQEPDYSGMKAVLGIEVEGEKLVNDVLYRADNILSMVEKVEELSPKTVAEYKERLEKKIREVLDNKDIDDQRIVTEVAIFADKVAVDEETVRLRTHIDHLKELLASGDVVGKKLDFIVQEMNREANTTGSKCQDVNVTKIVVDIKSEIEKIREQIQNIE